MPLRSQSDFAAALITSAVMVSTLFIVLGVETFFRLPLNQYGIVPRTPSGLIGIALSPFLHASLNHLLANALPLFVLLTTLLSDRKYRPYWALALVWTASGVGTWLIGRAHSVHIGASSIIFGLASFLIAAGLLMRSWRAAAIAILVFLFYGGIFYGVLPRRGPISWEGHLCGAIAGVWAARSLVQSK